MVTFTELALFIGVLFGMGYLASAFGKASFRSRLNVDTGLDRFLAAKDLSAMQTLSKPELPPLDQVLATAQNLPKEPPAELNPDNIQATDEKEKQVESVLSASIDNGRKEEEAVNVLTEDAMVEVAAQQDETEVEQKELQEDAKEEENDKRTIITDTAKAQQLELELRQETDIIKQLQAAEQQQPEQAIQLRAQEVKLEQEATTKAAQIELFKEEAQALKEIVNSEECKTLPSLELQAQQKAATIRNNEQERVKQQEELNKLLEEKINLELAIKRTSQYYRFLANLKFDCEKQTKPKQYDELTKKPGLTDLERVERTKLKVEWNKKAENMVAAKLTAINKTSKQYRIVPPFKKNFQPLTQLGMQQASNRLKQLEALCQPLEKKLAAQLHDEQKAKEELATLIQKGQDNREKIRLKRARARAQFHGKSALSRVRTQQALANAA